MKIVGVEPDLALCVFEFCSKVRVGGWESLFDHPPDRRVLELFDPWLVRRSERRVAVIDERRTIAAAA